MRNVTRPASYLLVVIMFFVGCKKEPRENPDPTNKYFVSASPVGSFTKAELQALAVKTGFGNFAPLAKYDVDYFKIVYKTLYKEKWINVSGLLGIPKNVTVAPSLLSAQHGTMFKASEAPSNFPNTFSGFELFASAGFVTLIPDFIGYGVSQDIVHPYFDKKYSGLTVVDMIKAVKYYLTTKQATTSNRLFLVGYSEGGYVSMAAQQEIETDPSHNLSLTAAAEGAGGYDLNVIVNTIATSPTYAAPSFLAFIIKAYNNTYNWNRPYSDFFQEPYASRIPELLNGSKTREEIDPALSNSTAAFFNPVFYTNLLVPGKETELKQQLTRNSFLDWVPKSPTRLYHGTADEAVPLASSLVTYNRFLAVGANNVAFFPIPGFTHRGAIEPMMLNALPWILSLDK